MSFKRNAVGNFCEEQWLALKVGLWLSRLPVTLGMNTLPDFMRELDTKSARRYESNTLTVERVARIVHCVARLRLFNLSVFPRICLRRSLALYWVLRKMGQPCEFHIGVHSDGPKLQAHSWVTINGLPVFEPSSADMFQLLFSYPTAQTD